MELESATGSEVQTAPSDSSSEDCCEEVFRVEDVFRVYVNTEDASTKAYDETNKLSNTASGPPPEKCKEQANGAFIHTNVFIHDECLYTGKYLLDEYLSI